MDGHIQLYKNNDLTYEEKHKLIMRIYSQTHNDIYLLNEANPANQLQGGILHNYLYTLPKNLEHLSGATLNVISQNELLDNMVAVEIYYNTVANNSIYLITLTEKMYALLSIDNTLEA